MKAEEALALVGGHVDEELILRNEYLAAENEILRSKLPARVPMTDSERMRLAKLGKRLGLKVLKGVAAIVTPQTILDWYRRLVAKKYDGAPSRSKGGRPPIDEAIEKLIVQFAEQNPSWGYDRIVGALKNLGHSVSDETVGHVLVKHGIPPAPGRKPKVPWADFIAAHQDTLVAADFFTVEVLTPAGLICFYVLFFIKVATRRVHIAGISVNPTEAWMQQVARNVTMADVGFLSGSTHLIIDRDSKFSSAFRSIIKSGGIEILRLPPRSPNLNSYAERFVRTVKEECLSKLILFGEAGLRHALDQFLAHYHEERNHQGKDNVLLFPQQESGTGGPVECKERLGGMLKYYYRKAS